MEIEGEFVNVPYQIKGHVIGKNGSMIHKIEEMSGARVNSKSKEEEGFTVSGNEEQRAKAKIFFFFLTVLFSMLLQILCNPYPTITFSILHQYQF